VGRTVATEKRKDSVSLLASPTVSIFKGNQNKLLSPSLAHTRVLINKIIFLVLWGKLFGTAAIAETLKLKKKHLRMTPGE
jgi:hypothetical protein